MSISLLVEFYDILQTLEYLKDSYEAGDFQNTARVFTTESLLSVGYNNFQNTARVFTTESLSSVGYDQYNTKKEIELFWTEMGELTPNMTYSIDQHDIEASQLFGIFDMENGGVFDFDITYDNPPNLITQAILSPSNEYLNFVVSPPKGAKGQSSC